MEQVGQVVSVVVLDTVDVSEVITGVDTSRQVVHSEEVIPAMDELGADEPGVALVEVEDEPCDEV